MRTQVADNYIYNGFGFPIELNNITLYETSENQWAPKINLEALSDQVVLVFQNKAGILTGNELFFLRSYMISSTVEFAQILNVEIKTIRAWENLRKKTIPYSEITNQSIQNLINNLAEKINDKYK